MPAPFATFADRVENWGRWCRVSGRGAACARSAEGAYRVPDWESDLGPRPIAPLPSDGWDVELGARLLQLRCHMLLRLRHVERRSDAAIFAVLRKVAGVRLNTAGLVALEAIAVVELRDALAVPVPIRLARAQARARQALNGASDRARLHAIFADAR